MNALASALTAAMAASSNGLVVLDRHTGEWTHRPWGQVGADARAIAASIVDTGSTGAVGLAGDPTPEFVAAIVGAWLAGRSVSILPGPVRGADPAQWAAATARRFTGIGVDAVLATGTVLDLLRAHDDSATILDPAAASRHSALDTPVATDAPAVLQGTAGSTGTPRTAQLSSAAVLSNLRGLTQRVGVADGDVGCSWLPLYHDMGLTFLLSGMLTGVPVWLAPTAAFATSPFRWLSWLHDSRATLTAAPNFAYTVLGRYARRAPDVDLSRVRVAINGGEPIDCTGLDVFGSEMARLGFDAGALCPSYGLAEATCAVTVPTPGSGLRSDDIGGDGVDRDGGAGGPERHALLGEPIAGVELRVVDTDERHAEAFPGRTVGAVEIRGASLMSGYLGDTPLRPDDWFPTGDLGYLVDGDLVVCGRAKEVISVAGRNVFPTEVERVAAGVRGVRDGAVVAVGIGAGTARPGLVVTAEFRGRDEAATRSEVTARVAAECGIIPADVRLVPPGSLPRTSSGKLRRLAVRHELETT